MALGFGQRNRRKFTLYFLRCPVSGEVKYIGVTCNEDYRKISHVNKNKEEDSLNPRRRKWLEWLRSKKLKPIFEVKLTGLSWHSAVAAEKRLLLLHHTFRPWSLVNRAVYELGPIGDGGLGIFLRQLGRKAASRIDYYA